MADKTFDIYKNDKVEQKGVPSPVTIDGLNPDTQYDDYSATYAGKTDKTPLSFKTNDEKPSAPTVQVTSDDTKLFVKIVAGANNGSAIKSGKIYYTDGTNAKTMDLKPGDAGTISGLTNGTEYQVQGTVANNAGESPKSVVVKGTPKAPVVNVTGISLDKTTLTLETGQSDTLKAAIAPTNATDKAFTYSSSDESVATIGAKDGKITTIKSGDVDLIATSHDGGKTAKCALKVTDPEPTEPETPAEG